MCPETTTSKHESGSAAPRGTNPLYHAGRRLRVWWVLGVTEAGERRRSHENASGGHLPGVWAAGRWPDFTITLTRSQHLIETLEADPAKLPAFYLHMENVIAWCMDEIFRLSKSAEDDERKMKLVALEYRARLVLKRSRNLDAN